MIGIGFSSTKHEQKQETNILYLFGKRYNVIKND
jgi:hypothetical protein